MRGLLGVAGAAAAIALSGCGEREEGKSGRLLPPDSSRRVEVWAVGDAADGRPPGRRLARRVRAADPDLFLYLGDVYETGTAAEFRENYEPLYGALKRRTAPTPGNHEWDNRETGYYPYWRHAHGRRPPDFYAFRRAGWQILSLNSEAARERGSAQFRWLRGRLRKGTGNCRLAFLHRPRHSAGSHGDAPDLQPLWRLLRGRVRLVLGAHDHDSQHLRPVDGTHRFVAGAGGRELYPVDEPDRRLLFSDDRRFAALRLTLSAGEARYAFVDAAGTARHRGTVSCRSSTQAATASTKR